MATTAAFAEIAALAGDPARASMLHALMDGRALTATELAAVAGVTPQTASGHLARLAGAGLLALEKQGRHRYFRLGSPMIARMVESIMQVASMLEPPQKRIATGPRDQALRHARTCYDHLAGRLGVALADALVLQGHAQVEEDAGTITPSGVAFFTRLGVELAGHGVPRRTTRVLCRPCLDWSERRPHLAGVVGAALCSHCLDEGWVRRTPQSRAVTVTPAGATALRATFGIDLTT